MNPACIKTSIEAVTSGYRGNSAQRLEALTGTSCESLALVFLCNIAIVLLLFTFRYLDDNRLVSWAWVMNNTTLFTSLLLLLPGLVGAVLITRVPIEYHRLPWFLFIASFLVTLPLWSVPEVYVDSARYLAQAQVISDHGIFYFLREWGHAVPAWTDLPLVPMIFGLVSNLFVENRIVVQIVNSLFYSGTIVLAFITGEMLFNRTVGFFSSLFLLGMPYLLIQTPFMMVDVATMFFLSLAIFLVLKYILTGDLRWGVLAIIATPLALMSKYSAVAVIVCLFAGIWIVHGKISKQTVRQLMFLIAGTSMLLIPFLVGKYDVISQQLMLLFQYQVPALNRWQESHVSTFFFQIHPFISLAAVAAMVIAWRQGNTRALCLSVLVLLLLVTGIQRSRYLLILFPIVALLAAYALATIIDPKPGALIAGLITLTSLLITYNAYAPFLHGSSSDNLHQAGQYLNTLPEQQVQVFVLPQTRSSINPNISLPLLDIYTHKELLLGKSEFVFDDVREWNAATSPLRFTWSYDPVARYRKSEDIDADAIVVIGNEPAQISAFEQQDEFKGYYPAKTFFGQEGVFNYSTIVSVYRLSIMPSSSVNADPT